MNNFALYTGGAICHKTGTITFGAKSNVAFAYNIYDGGAIALSNGELNVDNDASLRFSYNSAYWSGGAVTIENGQLIINSYYCKFGLQQR